MNIQEVEKHVKFDLIFTLLIFIGVGLCFLLSIVFIFKPTSVKAKEITNTVNISAKAYMPCGQTSYNGKYCAYTMDPTYTVRSTNSTYNGVLNGITFQFSDMITSHAQYTMIIEAMSTDFRNNNLQVDVMASSQSDQLGTQISSYTWSYISKSKIQINFMQDNYNYHTVVLTGYPLTGVNTYGIKKVTLSYDDGINDNSDIINSNTQNTTDIINNNNTNSEETRQTIFEVGANIITELANRCPNMIDISKMQLCVLANNSGDLYCPTSNNSTLVSASNDTGYVEFNAPVSWRGVVFDYIRVNPTSTYYLNFDTSNLTSNLFKVAYYDSSKNFLQYQNYYNVTSKSLLIPANTHYVRFSIESSVPGNNFKINHLRFTPGNLGFCPYGTSTNKLDQLSSDFWEMIDKQEESNQLQEDQKDLQQEQNDYLMDDTNPTVNTSEMNNVIGQVNIQDPLNYLLTLPINLLTKLNTVITSGTCSRASFGELYGTELYLPCINFEHYLGSSLWGTIDTIVGIGLLAIILKKFYDSISNILSLGKEEEVRKGMELPTPMEFLAQILGGGK